jgi:hypothetical protein
MQQFQPPAPYFPGKPGAVEQIHAQSEAHYGDQCME